VEKAVSHVVDGVKELLARSQQPVEVRPEPR
jgi:hypothetical protein